MKPWMAAVKKMARDYPLLALLALGLGGWYVASALGWTTTGNATQEAAQRQQAQTLAQGHREAALERARQQKEALRQQQEETKAQHQLQQEVSALRKEVQTVRAERIKAGEASTQEQKRLADEVQRLRSDLARKPKPDPGLSKGAMAPAQLPATMVAARTVPVSQAPVAVPRARLTSLFSDHKDTVHGTPQTPARKDVPYLPTGCFAEGVVVTGVMATTRANSAMPMLFAVTKEFTCPQMLQGPYRQPLATATPVQGCLVLGKAVGDLASSRVHGRLGILSCVLPDHSSFEENIRGYITDLDGTYGVVGEVHHHRSAEELKAFITVVLGEASAAFGLARSKLLVANVNTGGPQPFSGVQRGIDQLTQFYIQQMELLLPTLWVQSAQKVRLVLEEGVALPGVPTTMLLARQGGIR